MLGGTLNMCNNTISNVSNISSTTGITFAGNTNLFDVAITRCFSITGRTGQDLGITPAAGQSVAIGGGLTLGNGYRPLYSNVTGSGPITTSRTTYGTHYYLTNSALSSVTLAVPDTALDLNAYWVFRNATGTYLSVTFTWPTIGVAPVPSVNVFSIPPSNAMTVMFVSSNSGGGNFGFYTSSNYWAVF
jgi:hypothetical protein